MYYPEQRYASKLTIIRRECVLPEGAIGTVRIGEGKRVDIRDVVANGVTPSRHIIIDAVVQLGLRKPEDLADILLIEPGDVVDADQVLAGKNPNRGRRIFAPVRGVITQIDEGRIIIQEMPELINLEAGVSGRIAQVLPGRGVIVEAVGALFQGVWGNNRNTIATLRIEPDEGLSSIQGDALDMRYSGAVILTRDTLNAAALKTMEALSCAGIIAPSMDSSLIETALEARQAVILMNGFGDVRMGITMFNALSEFEGRQVTIDARMNNRWEVRAPEIVINLPAQQGEVPSRPNVMLSLRSGMNVRVTREPHPGMIGRIIDLPKTPMMIDNGLRVACAQVELVAGETVFVPLANLEVLGR